MRPLRSWQGSWFPTRPRFKCTRLKTKSLVWFWHEADMRRNARGRAAAASLKSRRARGYSTGCQYAGWNS